MSGFLLHLLRHGALDQPGRLIGHGDVEATEAGIADCLDQAAGLAIERLASSDLRRAAAVGEALAAARGLALSRDARWRELDFGFWDGCASTAIDAEALARFWADPDACPPPGGERWSALVARVGAAIATLEPRPTLVVTHGGAMRAALAGLCGFTVAQSWAFDLPYAALLTLRVWPGPPAAAQIVGLSA